jgi:PAS domain S-box-containing protein
MNGLELIKEIRSVDTHTEIIVTIDRSETELLFKTFDLGIINYLAKPFEIDQLSVALCRCTARLDNAKSTKLQQENHSLLIKALDHCPSMITITDRNGTIKYINSQVNAVTGRSSNELVGKHVTRLFNGSSEAGKSINDALLQEQAWKGELVLKDGSGSELVEQAIVSPVHDQSGELKHFILYSEDVTRQKAAEEEIRKLNAELEYRVLKRTALLEASNREMDEFCDAISHELCGPLSRLQGLSKALFEDQNDELNENGREYLQRINQTSLQLKHIIDALLSLSQLTRRGISLQNVSLSSIATSIAKGLSSSDPERKVKFFVAPNIIVKGDNVLLKLVMENLLLYAWKSTEGHIPAQIEFGIARSNGNAVYFVRDNGCGFDMKYSTKLFKLFNRIQSNNNKSTISNGTELATAQRIIQRHGGRIWAVGELEKGSTFYFTL